MKSNQEQLTKRGLMDNNLIYQYEDYTKQQLILLLRQSADLRTLAIHLLDLKYHNDDDFTSILLEQLVKEKALYTKIKIQECLSNHGNINQMCKYLGKIGSNQYKVIPKRGSLKKSYPLPRDLIARSLAHMNLKYFQDFVDGLPNFTYYQLLEAIDALGFICFYNQELIHNHIYQFINDCLTQYEDDLLMTWKLITCLSGFKQSSTLLLELKDKVKHPTLIQEIERSLQLIDSHHY